MAWVADWRAALDKKSSPASWRQASDDELRVALMPQQLGAKGGKCSFHVKHGCLGHSRTLKCEMPADSLGRASRVIATGQKAPALESLLDLLRLVSRAPPCRLLFVGDSLMQDLYMASVFGAMRLGWRRRRWCSSFSANYREDENKSLPLWKACDTSIEHQCIFEATHPHIALHSSCSSLMLSFAENSKAAAGARFSTYSYVILNWGVHENDPRTFAEGMTRQVLPVLRATNIEQLVWLATHPQHFPAKDGSGLYGAPRPPPQPENPQNPKTRKPENPKI